MKTINTRYRHWAVVSKLNGAILRGRGGQLSIWRLRKSAVNYCPEYGEVVACAVLLGKNDCRDIERLLNGVRERIREVFKRHQKKMPRANPPRVLPKVITVKKD